MNKMIKVISLLLVLTMMAFCFTGCETAQQKAEKLAGTWYTTQLDDESEARSLLESFDFYEEEIALCDLNDLYYVQYAEFTTGLHYRFGYDIQGTKDCTRDYLDRCMQNMYSGRASLGWLYDVDLSNATPAEFKQFYADLYGYATYDEMINDMAENAYNYDAMETYETGSFTFDGDKLMCTITGETEAEYLGYKLNGDSLTLEFIDITMEFTR